MGGNASTRRVVVEDTGGEEYISISEAVAKRLKGQPELDIVKKASETPSVPQPQVQHQLQPQPQSRILEPEPRSALVRNKELDEFYIQKLKDLQERTAALQKVTNEHFANAVKEVEQKFLHVTASPVCQDLQAKVLECYQSNPGEILNCSALVNAFTTCVDRARMTVSASRVQVAN